MSVGPEHLQPDPVRMMAREFYGDWGEYISLSGSETEKLYHIMANKYVPLEGHNLEHVDAVTQTMMAQALACSKIGMKIDFDVIVFTGLGHDLGLPDVYKRAGKPTAQTYAAAESRQIAAQFGLSTEQQDEIEYAISSSTEGAEPKTLLALLLRRADMDNVGEDYDTTFRPRTDAFMAEAIQLKELMGGDFDENTFMQRSIARLVLYVGTIKMLGPWDAEWHSHAFSNISRLVGETALAQHLSRSELFGKVEQQLEGTPLLHQLLENPLYRKLREQAKGRAAS